MSSSHHHHHNNDAAAAAAAAAAPSLFQIRRSELLSSISASLETVLQQVNQLNRTLEGIIEIGNDFGSVEALWSQFETVMGKTTTDNDRGDDVDEEDQTEQTITELDSGEGGDADPTVRLKRGEKQR